MVVASKLAVQSLPWWAMATSQWLLTTLLTWCAVRELLHAFAVPGSLLARRAVFSRFIDIVASVAYIYRCTGGGSSSSVVRLILLVMLWLDFMGRGWD